MSPRLPSLNALKAFEAAARHASLTKAATELHVTPAAISHQVKLLEQELGVTLFRRIKRDLVLTEAAKAGLPTLRQGFERLAQAARIMRDDQSQRFLTVSAAPAFAASWLVPRLDRFRQKHPDIDVRLDTRSDLVDFSHDNVDVAIRYGTGDYAGLKAVPLFGEEMVPLCSPGYQEGRRPLGEPDDLSAYTLLHVDWTPEKGGVWPTWEMWLLAAGATAVDASRGPRFTNQSLAIQAAIQGHGVVLGNSALVSDDLDAGRLVKPFDLSVPIAFGYYIVAPERTAQRAKIVAFRTWIQDEAERTLAAHPPTV